MARESSEIPGRGDDRGGPTATSPPDREATQSSEPPEVPSLEEVLAAIERDARKEEEVDDSRRRFFDIGNDRQLANASPAVPPTKEELEVQADVMTHLGKFSYGSMKAFGDAILAEAKRRTPLEVVEDVHQLR